MKSLRSIRGLTALTLGLLTAPLWPAHAEFLDVEKNLIYRQQTDIYETSLKIQNYYSLSKSEQASQLSDLVQPLNEATLADLNSHAIKSSGDPKRAEHITKEQAQQVLRMMNNHPIIGISAMDQYDPTGDMGFCFGRATFVHLELLRRGVNKNSIAKLFVVGSMTTGESNWRYHVTTIVKGPDDVWWAIDNVVGYVVTAEEWTRQMQQYDVNPSSPTLLFYVSKPQRLGPNEAYLPGSNGLSHPGYRKYFDDLMTWFKKNPVRQEQSFKLQ